VAKKLTVKKNFKKLRNKITPVRYQTLTQWTKTNSHDLMLKKHQLTHCTNSWRPFPKRCSATFAWRNVMYSVFLK